MRQLSLPTINFDRCLQLFLFLSPILWLPGIEQNSLQFILFDFGAILLLPLAIMFGVQRECRNPAPATIVACGIILSLMINPKAYPIGMIHLVAGVLLYYAIVLGVKNPRKILWTFAAVMVVNIVIAIAQKTGFYLVYDTGSITNTSIKESHLSMPGLMGRNYHLGYIMVFLTPLCFILKKWLGWIMMLISLLFIVLIESWACRLAFGTMSLVLLSRMIPKRYLLISILLIAGLVTSLYHPVLQRKIRVRTDSYNYIINESLINIFKGRGIGTFDIDTRLYDADSIVESSFNQYLRTIYEMGIIPFLIMCMAFWKYFKSFTSKNIYFLASIAAILTYPMFHEVLRFARFNILIIAVVALFEISCINRQSQLFKEIGHVKS